MFHSQDGPQGPALGQAKVRSQELHLSFLCWWQKIKYLGHLSLFPKVISMKVTVSGAVQT